MSERMIDVDGMLYFVPRDGIEDDETLHKRCKFIKDHLHRCLRNSPNPMLFNTLLHWSSLWSMKQNGVCTFTPAVETEFASIFVKSPRTDRV
jgi:hypothetical protein